MLHEIFKGMDNAAERINNNFLYGSIVEDNLNEINPTNGYYVKFGNGFQVCWKTLPDRASVHEWEYPSSFAESPFLVVLPTSNTNFWQESKSSNSATIRTAASTWIQCGAIGIWKKEN